MRYRYHDPGLLRCNGFLAISTSFGFLFIYCQNLFPYSQEFPIIESGCHPSISSIPCREEPKFPFSAAVWFEFFLLHFSSLIALLYNTLYWNRDSGYTLHSCIQSELYVRFVIWHLGWCYGWVGGCVYSNIPNLDYCNALLQDTHRLFAFGVHLAHSNSPKVL